MPASAACLLGSLHVPDTWLDMGSAKFHGKNTRSSKPGQAERQLKVQSKSSPALLLCMLRESLAGVANSKYEERFALTAAALYNRAVPQPRRTAIRRAQ